MLEAFVLLFVLCLVLFFMAAGCLAICCYAMILSHYSNAVPWYGSVRDLTVYCHVIVIKLLPCCNILIVFCFHCFHTIA